MPTRLRSFLSVFCLAKKRPASRLILQYVWRHFLCAIFIITAHMVSAFDAQGAAYATGGTSQYLNTVLWLTWGNGQYGTNNFPLANGSQTSAVIQVSGNLKLTVQCALSNLQGTPLRSYRPGSYSGDSLDDLYNIGGTGAANRLVNAIATTAGVAQFTVTCSATLGNMPYRLKGLVMADAESLATSTDREFTRASADGVWNVVEMRKNGTNGTYYAKKSLNGNNQLISFGPGTDNKTAAVTFLTFNDSSYGENDRVAMDFALKGGGIQAIAIGLLAPYADYGDAPESYGDALHLVNNIELTSDGIPVGTSKNLNNSAYTPGRLESPSTNFIGSKGPDTEISSPHSDDALIDDNTPNPASPEEDAWPSNYTLPVLQAGESLTQRIACTGDGAVAGWIDFDRNGTFDSSERAFNSCVSGSAQLTWPQLPPELAAGKSYVRLRYSTNVTQLQSPVDYADNGEIEDRLITITAPDLTLQKSDNSQDGTWHVGEKDARYTLTVTNQGPVATGKASNSSGAPITVLDELPTGIHPNWDGIWTDNGWSCTATNQRVTCRTTQIIAAAGQAVNTSSFNLPVTVDYTAIGHPINHASVGGGMDSHNGGQPPDPTAQCNDSHCAHHAIDVPKPAVSYHKTASTQGPVSVGETIQYTLTLHVANGTTTDVVTLTDQLDDGLDLQSVDATTPLACPQSKPLTCSLPASTAAGDYTVTYRATVNRHATQTLSNTVSARGGDAPACDGSCQVTIPLAAPSVAYQKQSDTQGPVSVGDPITYTLTVQVDHSQTRDAVQLTDTFDPGLTFEALIGTSPFDCQASSPLHCTLAKGTPPGSYQVVYRVRVNGQASQSVTNRVSASGTDQPRCSANCAVTTPITPSHVSYRKSTTHSAPVAVGDTVDYVIQADVLASKTTQDLVLTDTAQPGLEFLAVDAAAPFQCATGNPLRCTLPAGTQPGSYAIHYSARVTAAAVGAVANQVDAQGGDNPTCAPASACHVSVPVAPAQVRFRKEALSAGPVNVGDTIRYRLHVTVTQSQTTEESLFTDQLGDGLDFDSVTDAGVFHCNPDHPVQCTLPARTPPGQYSVTYQAKVNASANGSVTNRVSGAGGTAPACDSSCDTTTPVNPPAIRYSKRSDHQGTVAVGDQINYTVIVDVSQAQTTSDLILTDQLGEGLRFEQFVGTSALRCGGSAPIQCTLPSGSAPGQYTVTYTARVTDHAKDQVENTVSGQGGSPSTQCGDRCTVDYPVEAPRVRYSKSSNAQSAVKVGDAITYQLTIQVSRSQTTHPLTLTDRLGRGLTFEAIDDAGQLTCTYTTELTCTLPRGAVPATYRVNYRARVNAEATGSVHNAVSGTSDDDNGCEGNCTNDTPVEAAAVGYHKSVDATGPVSVGDTLHYTLTVVVANSQTREDIGVTDTLAAGLTFAGLVEVQGMACATGEPLRCTVPAGSPPGAYSVRYGAKVNDQASKQISNSVQSDGRGNAHCDGQCVITTPVADTAVYYSKSSQTTGPVTVGQTLSFALTTEVKQSQTTQEVILTDQLGPGLAFDRITAAGAYHCTAGNPLRCTLPAGSVPGTYQVQYTATVTAAAKGTVHNGVSGSGGDGPQCDPQCGVSFDVAPARVRYGKKTAATEPVSVGDSIPYTLTVEVSRSQTSADVVITDRMATGLDFGSLIESGPLHCTAANPLVCTLPAATLPGTYLLRYNAIVTASAQGTVHNSVFATGIPDLACEGRCQIETPVRAAQVDYRKRAIDAPTTVAVGQTLTYEIATVVRYSQTGEDVTLSDSPEAGLDLLAVTEQGVYQCTLDRSLTCTLPKGTPPGTYRLHYTARVMPQASEAVTNHLTTRAGHADCATECSVRIPLTPSETVYAKSTKTTGAVAVGDQLTYTLTATVAQSQSTQPLELTDTFGPCLTFTSLTDQSAFHCTPGQPLRCTLPPGTPPGTYTVTYIATVNDSAAGQVKNALTQSGQSGGSCRGQCETVTPVKDSVLSYRKDVDGPSPAAVGDQLHYTLTTTIRQSKITQDFVLTDTLGDGLEFGQLDDAGAYRCTTGQRVVCTLAKDTVPGVYPLHYTAKIASHATQTVHNGVTASGVPNADCAGACAIDTPVASSRVRYHKTSDQTDAVDVGQTITYTLTVDVSQSQTTEPLAITDTLGKGLRFGKIVQAEGLRCQTGDALQCTLAAQTLPGSYRLVYTATVDDSAAESVTNHVIAQNPPGGDTDPQCDRCVVTLPVRKADIQLSKDAVPATGSSVHAGDVIHYTIAIDILHSATTTPINLVDTMEGQDVKAIDPSDRFQCTPQLACTLPSGTPPGHYELTYQTVVATSSLTTIRNTIAGHAGTHPLSACKKCLVEHTLADPHVAVHKESSPSPDTEIAVGQEIGYSLVAEIGNAPLRQPLVLTDIPDPGLDIGTAPTGCQADGQGLVCTLPSGTAPGIYRFNYRASVSSRASRQIGNTLRATMAGINLACAHCHLRHRITQDVALRVVKTASPRQAHLGDLVRYTIQIENLGRSDWHGGSMRDLPAKGLSYVAGSLRSADDDSNAILGPGRSPLRIDQIDIRAGHRATLTYLMRIGAGVRAATLHNTAEAIDANGNALSNRATADIALMHDPLLDRQLLFGTVFHDRDHDGWQDGASLTHVQVKGGFAASAYIAGSTTLDLGEGPKPLADASAPLLHGVTIGTLPGTGADGATRYVVHQRLRQLDFTNDFVMTSAQGWRLHMDAEGNVDRVRQHDAAHGRSSAQPDLTRHVMLRADQTYDVDYVVSNAGWDDEGLPGVRLATVDGVLVETDAHGRFHIAQDADRGSLAAQHTLVKLDPATVPPTAKLTTENPLLRRMTHGMPTRYSFGVALLEPQHNAAAAEITIGEKTFIADHASIDPRYAATMTDIAEQIAQRSGTSIVRLSVHPTALATDYSRAVVLYRTLSAQLPSAKRTAFVVQLTSDDAPLSPPLLTLDQRGVVVNQAVFEADRSAPKPHVHPLLAAIAQHEGPVTNPVVRLQPLAPDQPADAWQFHRQRAQQLMEILHTAHTHANPQTIRVEIPFDRVRATSSAREAQR